MTFAWVISVLPLCVEFRSRADCQLHANHFYPQWSLILILLSTWTTKFMCARSTWKKWRSRYTVLLTCDNVYKNIVWWTRVKTSVEIVMRLYQNEICSFKKYSEPFLIFITLLSLWMNMYMGIYVKEDNLWKVVFYFLQMVSNQFFSINGKLLQPLNHLVYPTMQFFKSCWTND